MAKQIIVLALMISFTLPNTAKAATRAEELLGLISNAEKEYNIPAGRLQPLKQDAELIVKKEEDNRVQ